MIEVSHFMLFSPLTKARSTLATMSQQRCRTVEATGNFVACCFDNFADLGNNVGAMFDFVERTQFQCKTRSTLLPFSATKSNVASTLLPKTATLSKQHSTLYSIRQCCFDIVAGVDRALEWCRESSDADHSRRQVNNSLLEFFATFCRRASHTHAAALSTGFMSRLSRAQEKWSEEFLLRSS